MCHKDFPYILGAAGNYDSKTLKNLIHALKFKYIKGAAEPLGKVLIDYAESLALPLDKFVVVPVPLSNKRARVRGFNQSELIASPFAKRFCLPLQSNCLYRIKNNSPQSEAKDLSERKRNVFGSFSIKNAALLQCRNVILIDDVVTSGATFYEAAKTLRRAGVKKIIAMAPAKA